MYCRAAAWWRPKRPKTARLRPGQIKAPQICDTGETEPPVRAVSVMKLIATTLAAVRPDTVSTASEEDDGGAPGDTERATGGVPRPRCRNCGRYYDGSEAACPHCGSGNRLRGGGPSGQTRRH